MWIIGIISVMMVLALMIGPVVGVLILMGRMKKAEDKIKALENQLNGIMQSEVHYVKENKETRVSQTFVKEKEEAVGGQERPVKFEESVSATASGKVRQDDFEVHQAQEEKSKHYMAPKIETVKTVQQKKEVPKWMEELFTVESIISKLGILLLLIGVGYLFKLAYDNGYITERLAVFFGFLIGGVLVFFGSKSASKGRTVLSQVLFGGGIATFYITTYAAYQGYGLIGGIMAFVLMCTVTAGGFVLALLSRNVSMSIIAVLGGLLTPFILALDQLGLKGTGIYIVMISTMAMGVYIYRRWRLLQVCTIIGAYVVTSYFITIDMATFDMQRQLAFLMLLLLVLFVGVSYGLAFVGKQSSKFPGITYIVAGTLPIMTMLQVHLTLSMAYESWAIVLGITALIYVILGYFLIQYGADMPLEVITFGLAGAFGLMALVFKLGSGVESIAIAALAIIFYGAWRKTKERYFQIIGHIIGTYSYVTSLYVLFDEGFPQEFDLSLLLVRLVYAMALMAMVYINRDKARQVVGVLTMIIYMPLLILAQGLALVPYKYEGSWVIAVLGLWPWCVFAVNKVKSIVPRLSLVIFIGFIPVIKLLLMSDGFFGDKVAYMEVGMLIVAALATYGLAVFAGEFFGDKKRTTMKIFSYLTLYMVALQDVSKVLDSFASGLVVMGLLMFVAMFIDSDREMGMFMKFREVVDYLWFLMVAAYSILSLGDNKFDKFTLVMDGALIVLVLFHIKYGIRKISKHILSIVMGLLFMLMVYTNMSPLPSGRGIITLLWAAFAIGLLAYGVVKSESKIVRVGMFFIIVVAAKFILIDLSEGTMAWKIIVSMAFGSALLVLSYFLQPLLSGEKKTS